MASLRALRSYEPAIAHSRGQLGNTASSLAASKIVSSLLLHLLWLPIAAAAPAPLGHHRTYVPFVEDDLPKEPSDPSLWAYLGTAAALVLLGGAFAGLTIALMGQDEIYLQVIATSGEGSEKDNAQRVLNLLKKGKHWVLVTLLLSNVITNETLPIVLDRSLGGGWPAVLGSTVLIVIFGEIAPQSICVRYGLPIGAFMSPFVLLLMWVLSPVAWPTAKLLDYLLGEDHGTTYKKAGLKTLVTLHRTLGTAADERLNKDEVTIISAVLDLKEKTVGRIMTPMQDVFILSADTVLDEEMMNRILAEGYSRIPIHSIESKTDFIGMLLVKMLITYDPEDCLRVRDFPLATLPETRPETSCLDIINFFQEGKSHMILVSEYPGEAYGALGVVTLEDVIEELIGEEIIDESDVFIDVHKAIRRLQPAPRFRVPKGEIVEQKATADAGAALNDAEEDNIEGAEGTGKPQAEGRTDASGAAASSSANSRKPSISDVEARSPGTTTYLMRRRSSGNTEPVAMRGTAPELLQHLKHLGPSNVASRPKPTQIKSVKIKPGVGQMTTLPETRQLPADGKRAPSRAQSLTEAAAAANNDERTSLMSRVSEPTPPGNDDRRKMLSPGRKASDGVHAVSYGTLSSSPTAKGRDLASRAQISSHVRNREGLFPKPVPEKTSPTPEQMSPRSHQSIADQEVSEDLIDLQEAHADKDPSQKTNPTNEQQPSHLAVQLQSQTSNPSRPKVRLQVQHTTQTPSAHVQVSQASDGERSLEQDNETTSFESPHKLVIELERQNSRTSELSEHESGDTLGSLHSFTPSPNSPTEIYAKQASTHVPARSGSITEQIIDVRGLKKVVLEAQPSSSDDELSADTTRDESAKSEEKRPLNGAVTVTVDDATMDKEEEDQEDDGVQLSASPFNEDADKKKKKKGKRSKKKPNSKKKENGQSASHASS